MRVELANENSAAQKLQQAQAQSHRKMLEQEDVAAKLWLENQKQEATTANLLIMFKKLQGSHEDNIMSSNEVQIQTSDQMSELRATLHSQHQRENASSVHYNVQLQA